MRCVLSFLSILLFPLADAPSTPLQDQTGDYVNYEVSFAYFAPPAQKKLHGNNISLIRNNFV